MTVRPPRGYMRAYLSVENKPFLPVNSKRWVAFNGGVPYREDGVHVRAPWRPREETEEELVAIAKREGAPDPFGAIRPAFPVWKFEPRRLSDEERKRRKAKNKRRAAARFRAREVRRASGASALAPAVLPALAAGLGPVSPEPEADIMSAIRDAARGG